MEVKATNKVVIEEQEIVEEAFNKNSGNKDIKMIRGALIKILDKADKDQQRLKKLKEARDLEGLMLIEQEDQFKKVIKTEHMDIKTDHSRSTRDQDELARIDHKEG